ncbi:uncharacterized protein LOC117100861 [Anneissia japonica]|uniref:uncharacterized protein LOC117100861 n=1 Tax=Anneissia japonica TaxID=1529436 RepID=UPI00142589F2|nr:uncharacterized protein LOC117100861 [Anneissia japonica]
MSVGMRSLKRRSVKLTPRKLELQSRNDKLRQRNKDLIERLQKTKPKKTFASAKQVKNKYLQQEIKRLKSRLEKEKEKVKGREMRQTVIQREKSLRRLLNYYKKKAQNVASQDMYDKLLKENEELKKQLHEKDQKLCEQENNIMLLQEKLSETAMQGQETVWDCKHGSSFNFETRELVFNMIDLGVPTKNVEDLVIKSGCTFGYSVSNPPKHSSVENMARELGAISDYQSAKFMLESEQLSLGIDATTREGIHVNGVYVSSKDDSNVIAFDELAGGTPVDYQVQIDESITNMAKVYCQVHDKSPTEVHSQLISKITSTMSDRAAVNHATIQLLEKKWKTKLTELNCHLHPLESIACSTALSNIEKQTGNQQKDLHSKAYKAFEWKFKLQNHMSSYGTFLHQ